MKRIILSTFLAAGTLAAGAQAYIDLRTLDVIEQAQAQAKDPNSTLSVGPNKGVNNGRITLLLQASPEAYDAISEIADIALERDGILVVETNLDNVERLAAVKGVSRIEASRTRVKHMNEARRRSTVDKAHVGEDLDHGYDGTGVIAALIDGGMDPNHINFLTEDDEGRCKALFYGTYSSLKSYTTPSSIMNYTTDDATEYHGTHVAGIMTGSYRDNGFYGVAPGADLVMGPSDLTDAGILRSLEAIVNYSKQTGQPAVVNMSLGDNSGAHDGTDSFAQALSSYADDVVICVSSGNEGEFKVGLPLDFTAGAGEVTTLVFPISYYADYNKNYVDDTFEFWSNDNSSFTVSCELYDDKGNLLETLGTITKANQNTSFTTNTVLKQYFSRVTTAKMSGGIDSANKRFNVYVNLNVTGASSNTYRSPKAYIGFTIKGKAGQKIYCYSSARNNEFTNRGLAGFTDGSYDGTVSGMACAKGLIAVGSYCTRNRVTLSSGTTYTWDDHIVGQLSDFSSWGTLADGRRLPHVVAPGSLIVSSVNTFCNTKWNSLRNGSVTYQGRTYYWDIEEGTSMAAPFASGTVALWLEADPTLTSDDVVEIINATSTRDSYVTSSTKPVAWGAGKINPYEGLRYILNHSGVGGVVADKATILFNKQGDVLEAALPGAALSAALYDLNGLVVKAVAAADAVTIDCSGIASGVYVLKVNSDNATLTRKVRL